MKYEKHGKRKTRLYRIWANIKTRCLNPHDPHYKNWGGRGITICEDWKNSFQSFYDWAVCNGYSENLTIDRIDCYGNYEPSNCRWITHLEQVKNKTTNIIITYGNKSMNCSEWAKELNLGHDTVRQRYHKGYSPEECLFGKKVIT